MGVDEDYESLKTQRAVAKGRFTRKVNTFTAAHTDDSPVAVLSGIYEEVNLAFEKVEKLNDDMLELIYKSGKEKKFIEEAEDYVYQLEVSRLEVKVQLEKSKNVRNSASLASGKTNISVKKIDPPSFSGDLRSYPNFKEDFDRLVVPAFGKDPYVLRQCLSGEALQSVKGVENDYDAMYNRLNEKYGSHRKLVDLITSDLRALKPLVDGDDRGLIKTIETVERCFLDLKRMGLEGEMNTSNIMGLVERVLPPIQKREWVAVMDESNVGCSSDFKELLDYLLKQKRRVEYMSSTIRTQSSKFNVNVSTVEDHETDLRTLIKDLSANQANLEKQLLNVTKTLTNQNSSNKKAEESGLSRWCWVHDTNTHDTQDCFNFKFLNDKDKVDMLRGKGVCYNCLKGKHLARNCTVGRGCTVMTKNGECGRRHHALLHKAQVEGSMSQCTMNKGLLNDKSTIMLMISYVYHRGIPITTLWDSGSDITVITHTMAKELGLTGKEVTMSITKVGNVTESCLSKEYIVPLTDRQGKIWKIKAYGLDEITSNARAVDTQELARILRVEPHLLLRQEGKVDLLIGTDCFELFPKVIRTVGGIQLMENQFGYCVRGRSNDSMSRDYSDSHFTVNHVSIGGNNCEIDVCREPDLKTSLDVVFDGDPDVRQSDNCVCKQLIHNECTLRERRELELIEQGLSYDQLNKVWVAKYPWIKDPNNLPNNFVSAIYRMKATEKRLTKQGVEHCKMYQDQMNEMITKGVARKLHKEEIDSHVGPVHYVHHHEIMKQSSASTPMRIVFDSSSTFQGHQLNSYWAKGPDILNSMLGVLLRMRQEKVVIVGDISRMYHTVKLDKQDQHVHRFLWRNFNLSRQPQQYVLTTVTFGDRPSGIIATLAIRHTAEKFLIEYPDAARMIIKNTYVDDMVQSVSSTSKALTVIREAECILSTAGFVVKHWMMSGRGGDVQGIKLLKAQTEKVLGMSWDVEKDEFFYVVKINFSAKQRNVRSGPNILCSQLKSEFPDTITRRMVLSQVASVFDPLGFVQPFMLTAKLLMREMILNSKDKGWDEPIQQQYKTRWMRFFSDLYKLESFKIKRPMKPDEAVGNPTLIIFSDGSKDAYGAVAYCRFETLSGDFKSSIIMAKNKVTPARQISIPRIELCAAVLSCRLRRKITEETEWDFEKIYHIVDSEIVRAQIQKDSHKFRSFVGTRVAEIQAESNPSEWWWVRSDDNPADMLTRAVGIEQLGSNSPWRDGPGFLSFPVESWPVQQTIMSDLPDKVSHVVTCDDYVYQCSSSRREKSRVDLISVIDLGEFSSYSRLLKLTSRLMEVAKDKSFKALSKDISSYHIKEAEKLWVLEVQKEYGKDWAKRFQRLGPEITKEGIITVGSRMKSLLRRNWNADMYMLLPNNHMFTYLYLLHLHSIDHSGVDSTIVKLRRKYWVPGAARVVKSVIHRCVTCKKLSLQRAGQKMGELREERAKPSPPFFHTACDIFGPFKVRDTVKRRTFGKGFGIIFNCVSSRAVYLDLIDGYDTQSFLMTLRRFVSIRGYPSSMYTDRGTQLVSASKELRQMFSGLDWRDIHNFGHNEGMDWIFTNSADAPWQNGISEALIRSVKRSLKVSIGESTFTFGELQTVLFEVANLLNERPIGTKPGSDVNDGCYLCPNELLLGRASNHAPSGVWMNCGYNKRLRFLNDVIDGFWHKWQRDYFPSLIIEQKWHAAKRNMKVGDLVLVQDSNLIRGSWRMAQVSFAQPGRDGLVRDVTIRYKRQTPGASYKGTDDTEIKRSVHRLVVILPVDEQ